MLKPKHSGFYSTTLEVLLEHLGVHTLILTGMAAEICVLFTANDAYMRDYRIIIPGNCVASEQQEVTLNTLRMMERVLKADISPSEKLDLKALLKNNE